MSKRYMKLSANAFSGRWPIVFEFLLASFQTMLFPQEFSPLNFKGQNAGYFPSKSFPDALILSRVAVEILFKGYAICSITNGEIQWLDLPAPTGDNKE